MKNLIIFEAQIEKYYAYNKTCIVMSCLTFLGAYSKFVLFQPFL